MEHQHADSFSIACTTCQAQLRVRDRSAIGQILTCPKCGSMLLVEAPEGSVEANQRRNPPPLPTPEAPAKEREAEEQVTTNTDLSDTVDDPTVYGTVDEFPVEDAVPEELAGSETPAEASSEQPIVPTDEWSSASSMQWRSWALIIVAGIMGVGLAIAVLGWIIGNHGAQQPPTSASRPNAENDSPNPPPPTEKTPPEEEKPAAADNKPEPTQPPPEKAKKPEPQPPVERLEKTEPGDSKPTPSVPPETTTPNPGEKVATPDDLSPPGFVPSAKPEETELSPAESLRKTLRAFGVLLEDEPLPELGASPEEIRPPERERGEARPKPRNVDLPARLSDRFEVIEFNETPLIDFLGFVSDYSTIPVTLDPDVLPWLGLSPATPISVRQSETSVAQLLEAALEPHGLDYTPVDNQILVTLPEKPDAPLRVVKWDVSDLTAGDATRRDELRALIPQLVSPESWEPAGGRGSILAEEGAFTFQQRRTVLHQVLELLEKLRVARGLPPQSPFPADMFRLERRLQRAAEALNRHISVNYIRPTPFPRIVSRIAEEMKVHLLVDWRAAAKVGWNPDGMVQVRASDQAARLALQSLLDPMDLVIRAVDSELLQITTRAALDTHQDLEFYPLADILSEEFTYEQLEERIRAQVGEGSFRAAGGRGMLHFDRESQHLIASLPQPKQATLEALLEELR
jgi:hypothetical protein